MLDLLKEKTTGQISACVLMFIMFLQVIALLFEDHLFTWKDEIFLDIFQQLCQYARIIGAINKSGSSLYFLIFYYFALFYIVVIIGLLAYLHFALLRPEYYLETIIKALRSLLILFYWVFFMPFFELFISVFHCDGGQHYIMQDIGCFSSNHIIFCVFASFGLLFLLVINIIIALLYNETQPVKEDSLSRFVSIFFGSMINIYAWISLNCLLTMFELVKGHLIIIFATTPLVIYFVAFVRDRRIEILMNQSLDKINTDIDAMIQINTIKDLSISKIGNKTVGDSVDKEMQVKGVINVHLEECKNEFCICKNLDELYDVSQQSFLTPSQDLHNETIFVNHYNKKMFEDALNKFINSPSLHISFSFYLFQVMKNIHAALHELNIASKKKPSIQQQFTIFRYKMMIEQYVKVEEIKNKYIYQQLTNVKEFEKLHQDMQKSIEAVCNYQVEFWTHLTTVVPDLNILNELGNKIYNSSTMADNYWKQLCMINSSYPPALQLYGEYLSFIKNHPQIGKPFIERAQMTNVAHNSMDENIKRSDVLFSEDSTVVHISGNKESSGRILKVSQGLMKCFGYNKTEVIGHNISFMMPGLVGIRHNDFLDKFYKTGRQRVFNVERPIFAVNRQGHCFRSKVLVKQLPSLKEEYDYILTDMNGNIDSFSKGITSLLGLSPQLFKENNDINIQLICPELIEIFEQRRKLIKLASQYKVEEKKQVIQSQPSYYNREDQKIEPDTAFTNCKLAQPGGDVLAIIIPQNFATLAKSEKTTKQRGGGKKKNGTQAESDLLGNQKLIRSPAFRDFLKFLSKGRSNTKKIPDLRKLLQSKEYKENEKFKIISMELDLEICRINRSEHGALKYLVFKIQNTSNKKTHEMNDDENDIISLQDDLDQHNQLKAASHIIQEVFGNREDGMGFNRQPTNTQNFPSQFKRGMTTDELSHTNSRAKIQSSSTLKDPERNQQLREIDIRRETQQIIGTKKVGFKEEANDQRARAMKQQTSFQDRVQLQQQQESQFRKLEMSVTFLDKSISEHVSDRKNSGQNDITSGHTFNKTNDMETIENVLRNARIQDRQQHGEEEKLLLKEKNEENIIFNGQKQVEERVPGPQQQKQGNMLGIGQRINQEDKDTPRIDVKKDISISEKTKKRTQNLNEQILNKKASTQNVEKPGNNSSNSMSQNSQSLNSSLKSKKKSLQQLKQPQFDDQKPLLEKTQRDNDENEMPKSLVDQSEGDNNKSMVDIEEDFEEEIEEIIEEIDEEGEEYGDEEYNEFNQDGQNEQQQQQQQMQNGFGQAVDNFNNFNAAGLPQQPPKKRKLRNYEKIVTNPKFKDMDVESCGSAYFKDWEFQNEELDIRDLVKKVENRKQRREKKRKRQLHAIEEEQKKQAKKLVVQKQKEEDEKDKQNNQDAKIDDEEEDDSVAENNEAAEQANEGEQDEESGGEEDAHQRMLKEEPDNGEVSSIASSIFSQTRSYYSLRNAIDEKFIPLSIKNLKIIANILCLALLILEITQFIIQQNLFSDIHDNVQNIKHSEKRVFDIIDINLRIQNLRFLNEDIFNATQLGFYSNKTTLSDSQNQLLLVSSTSLKDNQNYLQFSTADFDSSTRKQINPDNVVLNYENVQNMSSVIVQNIWESVIAIVVFAQELNAAPTKIISSNPEVSFIQNNCLNSVLIALKESTTAIISATDSQTEKSISLFMTLLIAVSCALFFAMGFLLPVINKAKKSKQEVLRLFLLKKVEKSIDDQLKLCRWFITKYQVQNENFGQMGGDAADANDNIDDNIGGMNEKELKKEKEELYNLKKQKKNKKWKRLNTNFGLLALRVIFIVAVLEAFFIMNYLISKKFMYEVSSLTDELKLLISRQPLFTQILLVQKELFYSNGTAQVLNINVKDLVAQLNEQLIKEQQELLELFQSNYGLHDSKYNNDFNNLMYSNMCEHIAFTNITQLECETFSQGILKKGLYSTITRYLNNLRDLNSKFLILKKPTDTVKDYINDPKLNATEIACDLYMKQIHLHLEKLLIEQIDLFFQKEFILDRAIFILYLFYLMLIYFLIWKLFLSKMMDELWRAKSMLSVLPIEVCFKIEEIRNFIYKNSTNTSQFQ